MTTVAPENDTSPIVRLLYTTPLGQFCRHPEIAAALAQDKLATLIAPFLHIPDLLSNERRLLRDWELERPQPYAAARASAAEIERSFANVKPEIRDLRVLLHLSAHRRIDAAAVGREIFVPCPAFFGEPHIACELANGFTLKLGIVRMAHYWPRPDSDARSHRWRSDPELVSAVERALLPLLPPAGAREEEQFATAAELWLTLAPLRDFEACSSLPLFPYTTIYPEGYVPRGYQVRIQPATMRTLGGSYLTLAAAGLSPYIAECFSACCETRRELLAEWTEDIISLAVDKWGRLVA